MTEPHSDAISTETDFFDEEFSGDWTTLEPVQVPTLDRLPPAGVDIIARRLGIELQDKDVPLWRKMAANEWFWRRLRGQRVTYTQVCRGGAYANAAPPAATMADPTTPPVPSS